MAAKRAFLRVEPANSAADNTFAESFGNSAYHSESNPANPAHADPVKIADWLSGELLGACGWGTTAALRADKSLRVVNGHLTVTRLIDVVE